MSFFLSHVKISTHVIYLLMLSFDGKTPTMPLTLLLLTHAKIFHAKI